MKKAFFSIEKFVLWKPVYKNARTPLNPPPLPEQSKFSSNCAYNTGHFLTRIPYNLVYFYTKNAQKVEFSITKVR